MRFGSRVDDAKRGGDIDLMLDLAKPAANPARLRAEVIAWLLSTELRCERAAASAQINAPCY
ncbi:MAG: hypothetical protein QM533_01170 [Cytophagales bacterium]|nr:hypothetical protein [Cytophagales bacterium]